MIFGKISARTSGFRFRFVRKNGWAALCLAILFALSAGELSAISLFGKNAVRTKVTEDEFASEIDRVLKGCSVRFSAKVKSDDSEIVTVNGYADCKAGSVMSEFGVTFSDFYSSIVHGMIGFSPNGVYEARAFWKETEAGVDLKSFACSRDDLGNVLSTKDVPEKVVEFLAEFKKSGMSVRNLKLADFVYEDGSYRRYLADGKSGAASALSLRFENGMLKSTVTKSDIPLDEYMRGFAVTVTAVCTFVK